MPDMGFLRGVITVLTLGTFLGICWWAYRPGNRSRFDEDAWMAFDEAERPGSTGENAQDRKGEGA